ncbi:pyridoxamine 5'-phosphate oxidase [Piscirickettsia litoralis]|uniref:pyridoxamine 5'-phosphate oxidase n=1 Tax=Piscirickettsia litoralis TaxID=1891921 RepID=UPI000AF25E68|nr:pyridoxamine 5'-phosphate oxidase [Piscirickettsia litoralis]
MKISHIRREYSGQTLTLENSAKNPIDQFTTWLEEVTGTEATDPTAMTLATVDANGHPDLRIVLLKGVSEQGFNFFTNYNSAKGQELTQTPHAAVNFYWPSLTRQVKIRGSVEKLTESESDHYFKSRPKGSQIAAIASPQSQTIDQEQLLQDFKILEEKFQNQDAPPRPGILGRLSINCK